MKQQRLGVKTGGHGCLTFKASSVSIGVSSSGYCERDINGAVPFFDKPLFSYHQNDTGECSG